MEFEQHRWAADCGCAACVGWRLLEARDWDGYGAFVADATARGLVMSLLLETVPKDDAAPGERHRLALDCGCGICAATRLATRGQWAAYGEAVAALLRDYRAQAVLCAMTPIPRPPGRQYIVQEVGARYDEFAPDFTTVTELHVCEGGATLPGALVAAGLVATTVVGIGSAVQPPLDASGELVTHPRGGGRV